MKGDREKIKEFEAIIKRFSLFVKANIQNSMSKKAGLTLMM